MNIMPVKNAISSVGKAVEQKSPAILTGIGIGSFVGCAILAVKATPKAIQLMNRKAQEKYCEFLEPAGQVEYETYEEWLDIEDLTVVPPRVYFNVLTPVEVVKSTWKAYIPAVGLGVVGIVCLIGAARVSSARNAAFALTPPARPPHPSMTRSVAALPRPRA